MSIRDEIKLESLGMDVGASRRIVCPVCNGGMSGERSMNLSRVADGVLYNCHRSSCGSQGFVGTSAYALNAHAPKRKVSNYEGELLELTAEDEAAFRRRFEIAGAKTWIQRNENDEYVLPITGPDGKIRGYNVRQPWHDMPRRGRPNRPKADVYMHSAMPVQSFYTNYDRFGPLILVEDQLSAIKAITHTSICCAVAIMGAHLDIPRVREIALLRPAEVLLALDADATETSFKLAREYGLAFPKLRVVILEQDIKDTPASEINTVLGL